MSEKLSTNHNRATLRFGDEGYTRNEKESAWLPLISNLTRHFFKNSSYGCHIMLKNTLFREFKQMTRS